MSTARDLSTLIDPETAALPEAIRITGITYGPIDSRRFGKVIGINILGTENKVCSFDCGYCDLGSTQMRLNRLKRDVKFPTPEEVTEALNSTFRDIHENGPAINAISIAGNGEPTLHPDFPEVIDAILAARDRWLPGKPVQILTNGANLDTRKISEALNKLDERIVKIDAGNEKTFKAVNAPLSRTTLARVLAGLRNLKDVVVQSLFIQGIVDNTKPSDIDDWIEVIAIVKPKMVHIHGMSRQPAIPGFLRCDEDTLYTIASRLERKTQIKSIVNI